MWLLLAVLALSMMGAGGVMVWQGLDIILVERGWTFVISGSVLFAGGAVLLALSLVLRELRQITREPLAIADAADTAAQPTQPEPQIRGDAGSMAAETWPSAEAPVRPAFPPIAATGLAPAGAALAGSALVAGATLAATREAQPAGDDAPQEGLAARDRLDEPPLFDLPRFDDEPQPAPARIDGVPVLHQDPGLRDDPAFDELTADFGRIAIDRAQPIEAIDRPTQLDADRAQERALLDEPASEADLLPRQDEAQPEPAIPAEEPGPALRPTLVDLPPPPAPPPSAGGGLSARFRSWLSPKAAAPAPIAPPPPPPVPVTVVDAAPASELASPSDQRDGIDLQATEDQGPDTQGPDTQGSDLQGHDLAAFERELTERLTRDLALRDDWSDQAPADGPATETTQAASAQDASTPDEAPTLPVPDLDVLDAVERQIDQAAGQDEPSLAPDLDRELADRNLADDPAPQPDLAPQVQDDIAARDPFATGGRDWTAPALRPALGEEGGQAAPADEAKEDGAPGFGFEMPVVVRTYTAGENSYVIFSDGSIEAETPDGHFRFASIDEMKAFVAGGGKG